MTQLDSASLHPSCARQSRDDCLLAGARRHPATPGPYPPAPKTAPFRWLLARSQPPPFRPGQGDPLRGCPIAARPFFRPLTRSRGTGLLHAAQAAHRAHRRPPPTRWCPPLRKLGVDHHRHRPDGLAVGSGALPGAAGLTGDPVAALARNLLPDPGPQPHCDRDRGRIGPRSKPPVPAGTGRCGHAAATNPRSTTSTGTRLKPRDRRKAHLPTTVAEEVSPMHHHASQVAAFSRTGVRPKRCPQTESAHDWTMAPKRSHSKRHGHGPNPNEITPAARKTATECAGHGLVGPGGVGQGPRNPATRSAGVTMTRTTTPVRSRQLQTQGSQIPPRKHLDNSPRITTRDV